MKYLKLFESFDNVLTFDVGDIYWTNATISLSILRGTDVTDLDKIKKMIDDYKITYIKNGEWGGGPTNREWLRLYHNNFRLNEAEAFRAYKPFVKLTIKIENFGSIVLGFSIYSKKIYLFDASRIGKETNCPRCNGTGIDNNRQCTISGCRKGKIINSEYESEIKHISKFLKEEVWLKKLTYDEVIDKFNIDVEDDFNFTSIIDDNPGMS
jgi:hypothetical protein